MIHPRKNTTTQNHGLDAALDNELIRLSADALKGCARKD